MADMIITVGAQADVSYEQFKKDINALYTQLNSKPLKVKIQFNEASVKSMQSQITALYNSVNKLNSGSSGNAATQVAQQVAQAAAARATAEQQAANAINQRAAVEQRAASATQQSISAANQDAKAETTRTNAVKQYYNVVTQLENAVRNYTAAERSRNSGSRTAYSSIKSEAEAMRSYESSIKNGTVSIDEIKSRIASSSAVLKENTATLRANGDATKSLTDRWGGLASKFASWLSVSQVIMLAIRSMKQMVSATTEIDSAMTQLKIVTGATDTEMMQFLTKATGLAKELGQSITDVAGSIETFSRLGYNLTDSTELAKYANILANVANTDSETATTGLTSIIKGYNMDVSEAEHVADVLVEVGQKYAVSASEMMEAYEKSGAALSATNTSFEKSAGLIASANASVQDASTVGTALKTVSARIRGATSDLESLGEDTSDLAQGFSKYADEIEALTGFSILEEGTTDTYKDIYDIFEGVAQVWDDLSDTQQARISEILGGTRQLQVISSIIGNWGDAANAYADAMDAAGTSTKANDIYMESIEGHLGVLKSTFQELSADVFDSDFIKGLVDAATTLLNIIDGLVDKIGTLPTLITAITAGFSAKNIGRDKMSSLLKYADSITCSAGYGSFHNASREIHDGKRSLNMRGNRYNAATLLLWQQG